MGAFLTPPGFQHLCWGMHTPLLPSADTRVRCPSSQVVAFLTSIETTRPPSLHPLHGHAPHPAWTLAPHTGPIPQCGCPPYPEMLLVICPIICKYFLCLLAYLSCHSKSSHHSINKAHWWSHPFPLGISLPLWVPYSPIIFWFVQSVPLLVQSPEVSATPYCGRCKVEALGSMGKGESADLGSPYII